MTETRRIPYGVALADLGGSGGEGLGRAERDACGRDSTLWLELRPEEQGRSVVVRSEPGSEPVDVTPPGVSVLTLVHEYGGGSCAVAETTVVFREPGRPRLYRQEVAGMPRRDHPQARNPTRSAVRRHGRVARRPVDRLRSRIPRSRRPVVIAPSVVAGKGARGARSETRPPALERGGLLSWRMDRILPR
jgi:hypothetical protein